jgi:hypothetical protein
MAVELNKEKGRLRSPSSHPLRELVIELFDGVSLEEKHEEKGNKPLNSKPSWNSLLNKLKKH